MDHIMKYSNAAISKMDEDDLSKFFEIDNDFGRVTFMTPYITNELPINDMRPKNLLSALNTKRLANEAFVRSKSYERAIELYNSAVVLCPQNTENERRELCQIVGNRTSVLMDLLEFEAVIDDIEWICRMGCYPNNLLYRLYITKARCHLLLAHDASKSDEMLKMALESCPLDMKETVQQIIKNPLEINKARTQNSPRYLSPDVVKNTRRPFHTHCREDKLHKSVTFSYSPEMGVYAKAADDIAIGTKIMSQKAFASVINFADRLYNCHTCCMSVRLNPVPCTKCTNVVFCHKRACQETTFHKVECSILGSMQALQFPVNFMLAVRLLTQQPFSYFQSNREKFMKYLTSQLASPTEIVPLKSDYETAFHLVRNDNKICTSITVLFSTCAILLSHLLQLSGYYTDDSDRLYMAALIKRHLNILKFNSHEVCEVQPNNDLKGCGIGAALFTTLSRFNHSCEPNMTRYFYQNQVFVYAIRPIVKGEIINENYGPMFETDDRATRQEVLRNDYCFECTCLACNLDWPLFGDLKSDLIFSAPCTRKNCTGTVRILVTKTGQTGACDTCKEASTPMDQVIEKYRVLRMLGKQQYEHRNLNGGIQSYSSLLNIYYQFLEIPHRKISTHTQKVRDLLVLKGNTRRAIIS